MVVYFRQLREKPEIQWQNHRKEFLDSIRNLDAQMWH